MSPVQNNPYSRLLVYPPAARLGGAMPWTYAQITGHSLSSYASTLNAGVMEPPGGLTLGDQALWVQFRVASLLHSLG